MPDITMCSGNNCELSSICYRYKAEPSKYRQSYFTKPPNNGLECDYFWETKEQKEIKLLKEELAYYKRQNESNNRI